MSWPDPLQTEPSFSRMRLVLFLAGAGVFLYLRTFLLPATPFAAGEAISTLAQAHGLAGYARAEPDSPAPGWYWIVPGHREWSAAFQIVHGGARTAFTDRALLQKFRWLEERTHPSDRFFNDAALTLYLSLHNPTQTEFVTYDETTRPEQIASVVQALEHDPPGYISLLPVTPGPSVRGDHAAPLRRLVYDNYSLDSVFSQKQSQYEQQLWRRSTLSQHEKVEAR